VSSNPNVGRRVRFIRKETMTAYATTDDGARIGGTRTLKKGYEGRVINVTPGGTTVTVVYELPSSAEELRLYAIYKHNSSYEGRSWEYISEPDHPLQSDYHAMTIESERSYALYVASSSEDIKGYVPQVRYREDIVWQGEPVSTTDADGNDLSKSEQSQAALKAAEAKITEVVKAQFS
jgi:hypothetical protein